nr:uncharacterized protein LOC112291385 isoform X1 [Physcomitrium patens]|eukprot:XP_024394487.1 uncharacterized protein LOC112291385 isoform X1 [Physcomitrella patens]
MEIRELQEYVTKCCGDLYSEFSDFKRSISSQLLSLQEEVLALSFHNSSRNDGVFPESVNESPPHYRLETSEGRADDYPPWSSHVQAEDYDEYEKQAERFQHEVSQHRCPEGRSPRPDQQSPRQVEDLLCSHRPPNDDEEEERLITLVPANVWSDYATNVSEPPIRGVCAQAVTQYRKAIKRNQDSIYLSRNLHGFHSSNSAHGAHKSCSPRDGMRSGGSPKKNEYSSTSASVRREESYAQTKEYDTEKIEPAEGIVSECNSRKINNLDEIQIKADAGRGRFALKGWAASFLQQPSTRQVPKAVNKQYIQQEINKFKDERRPSDDASSEDMRGSQLRAERLIVQRPAEIEIVSKRHGASPAQGNLSRSNPEETRQNKTSIKPTADLNEHKQPKVSSQEKADPQFPGKKSRGGIAWDVDELAAGGR